MRSFWSDPYLWVHLAGIAALPIFLEICFLGLAVGDPVLPIGLELLLVAVIGIAPIVWMQWQRPFYIFSLVAIALKPEQLTINQRKLLRLFKAPSNRILGMVGSVVLLWVLWQLYRYAPIASELTPLQSGGRGLGLLIAAIAFLASNLFLQVPLSVASVLLTGETTFTAAEPYPLEQISKHFTSLGFPVKRVLPDIVVDLPKPAPVTTAKVASTAPLEPKDVAIAAETSPPSTPSATPETVANDSFDDLVDDLFSDEMSSDVIANDDLAADEIDSDVIASDDTDSEDIDITEPTPPIEPDAGRFADEVVTITSEEEPDRITPAEFSPEPNVIVDDILIEDLPIDITATEVSQEEETRNEREG